MKAKLLLLALAFGGLASANTVLAPGQSRYIQNDTVTCAASGGAASGSSVLICNCQLSQDNALVYGQAIGTDGTDLRNQCQAISPATLPFGCNSVITPVSCDCKESQSSPVNYGQAIGSQGKDLIAQCQALSPGIHPFNCHSSL